MALISMSGGHLRPAAPPKGSGLGKGIRGLTKATKAVGSTVKLTGHAVKPVVVRAPTTQTQTATTTPTTATDPTSDPFAFIKGLETSTDPAQAQALIDAVYAPQRQAINDQIAQSAANAQARATQMQQVYAAFAQYVQGLYPGGGTTSNANAAGQADGAALAQGMLGGAGAVGSHLAAAAQADSQIGAGTGWATAMSKMPGVYSLYAAQQVKQMLNVEGQNEQTLRLQLLDLSSKEAADVLSYLETAKQNDTQLQEWAYGQKQSQNAALANQKIAASKQQQAYLNYLQKQRQIDFNNAIAAGKLSVSQAKAQSDANYKASLLQLKQQGLITTAQYNAARVGIAQQNANTAKTRAGIAQQNANTAAYKATHPKPPKPSLSSNKPGTPAWNQKFRAQQTSTMSKARTEYNNLTTSTQTAGQNGKISTHYSKMTQAQAKIYIARKYLPDLVRIATALKQGGQFPKYTARQIADYWLNQLVG